MGGIEDDTLGGPEAPGITELTLFAIPQRTGNPPPLLNSSSMHGRELNLTISCEI